MVSFYKNNSVSCYSNFKFRFVFFFFLILPFFSFTAPFDSLPNYLSLKKRTAISYLILPMVDNQSEVQKSKLLEYNSREKIYKYGIPFDVNRSVFDEVIPYKNTNNEWVYHLGIESKNAISLNFIFSNVALKKGSYFYIVSTNSTKFIGPINTSFFSSLASYSSDILLGDNVVIELVEPDLNKGSSTLFLNKIIHGFRSLNSSVISAFSSCNFDVNSDLGKGFELQKKSVVMILNSSGGICTGTMLTTTNGPIKPYLLTAAHCGDDPSKWVFRFNWETPLNSSSSVDQLTDSLVLLNQSISGSFLKARDENSDFMLCELSRFPEDKWEVFYNGWSASITTPKIGVSIHHPMGEFKKISCDSDSLVKDYYEPGFPLNHWRTFWEYGITQNASSGAPLFDEFHRVIGQLHGGDSDCNSQFQTDYYGMFKFAWNDQKDSSKQLMHWLDPINSSRTSCNGQFKSKESGKNSFTDPFLFFASSNLKSRFCSNEISPKIYLSSSGNVPLKHAKVSYYLNDKYEGSIDWNGSISNYQIDTLTLPNFKLMDGKYKFSVRLFLDTFLIGDVEQNNVYHSSFEVASLSQKYTVDFLPDLYGNDTRWMLKDVNDSIIYSGGPYMFSTTQKKMITPICLTENCHLFSILDRGQNGINFDSKNGHFFLLDSKGAIVLSVVDEAANFGSVFSKEVCNTDNNNFLEILPNPTNEIGIRVTHSSDQIKSISIFSQDGKSVLELVSNDRSIFVPISNFSPGMYLLKAITDYGSVTSKFIKL